MKQAVYLAALALFLALSGCIEETPTSFSYEEPAGFESFEEEMVTMFYELSPEGEVGAVIAIMNPAPSTLSAAQVWQEMRQTDLEECISPGFELNENYPVKGIQGQQLITRCDNQAPPYTINRVLLKKGSQDIGLSFTALKENYEEKLPVFEKLLKSIQWE